MTTAAARVPTAPRYQPRLLEPAYDDREAVLRLVQSGGPYPNLAGMAGYAGFQLPPMAWFRSTLSQTSSSAPEKHPVLNNPRFIEAARDVFQSEIVRPQHVTLNVNMPQGPGGTHLDTATFRGDFPTSPWLLAVMGSSGLFERWAVRVPAALTWFYEGDGGGYEYWANGPDKPSATVDGPFGNIALIGDNDYMFHRTREFGDPRRYGDVALYGESSQVAFSDGCWIVSDQGVERVRYESEEIRVSLLWRSVAFKDVDAARVYDEHLDDLTTEGLIDVFLGDLTDHGIKCARPADHLNDTEWVEALNATYGVGGFEPDEG